MDTREKILPLTQATTQLQSGEWVAVIGRFDPLTAAQAVRLKAVSVPARKLLAIVLDNGDDLLPADARAALMAALRDVSAVTIAAAEEWRSAIPRAARVLVIEDAKSEESRSAEFVRFVIDRQASASNGGSAP